jgi:hypothetical protein
MTNLLNTSFVILIWFFVFGIQVFLNKKGIKYTTSPLIISALFFASSLALWFFVKDIFKPIRKNILTYFLAIIVLGLVAVGTWTVAKEFFPTLKSDFQIKAGNIHHLNLNPTFFFPKIIEIIFQQLVVFALVTLLSKIGVSKNTLPFVFALIFGSIHLPALFTISSSIGFIYIAISFLFSPIFALILLNLDHGFLVNITLHTSFYIFFPLAYRLYY